MERVPIWTEVLSALVPKALLRVLWAAVKMSTNVSNTDINVLSDVTTFQDRIVVFAPMDTKWLRMAGIAKTSMNASRKPTIADMTAKISSALLCVFARKAIASWAVLVTSAKTLMNVL